MNLRKMREQQAWENYDKVKTLYHLTRITPDSDLSVISKITQKGIMSGSTVDTESGVQPAIWFVVDKKAAVLVARELVMEHFALFSIRKRAIPRGTIRWDNVAEHSAAFSFYCLLDHIPPSYIHFVGVYTVIP